MNESNVKAILALLILLVAFGIFLLFNTYQATLLAASTFPLFLTLLVIGFGLLVCLLYLVNKKTHVVRSSPKKSSRPKKRKR